MRILSRVPALERATWGSLRWRRAVAAVGADDCSEVTIVVPTQPERQRFGIKRRVRHHPLALRPPNYLLRCATKLTLRIHGNSPKRLHGINVLLLNQSTLSGVRTSGSWANGGAKTLARSNGPEHWSQIGVRSDKPGLMVRLGIVVATHCDYASVESPTATVSHKRDEGAERVSFNRAVPAGPSPTKCTCSHRLACQNRPPNGITFGLIR
jgi:hypothetical protein